MKLGLSTYTYTWAVGVPGHLPAKTMSGPDLLERANSLGVSVVQIADNLPLEKLSAEALDQLEACACERGIQVEVGTRGIAPEHIQRFLELAGRFHSPILRVVIDTAAHHPSPAEVVEILRPQRGAFRQAGVTLAIENHDRFPAAVLAGIVRELGEDWVGVCLDTVNSFGALEGPRVVVDALGPLAVNLHVKDFAVTRAASQMGFSIEGRPAGQGRLDVPWLLDALRSYGRDCSAILELWTPPEAALEDTIAKERRWAEESIDYLRTMIAA